MAKISKKTIESLREFLDRGCDYAGTNLKRVSYGGIRHGKG